jgi:FtsZ-binding cell division protein ZapB
MAANKKIGRMDVLYEEMNRRKGKLQDEHLEACTKVAKLEATCASFKEREIQWQKDLMATQQRNSKLEVKLMFVLLGCW